MRSSENTAAASVDPTMAPTSSPSISGRSSAQHAVNPAIAAVTSTPSVASSADGFHTDLIDAMGVCSPPSYRIIAKASVPSACAASALLKMMPPMPPSPASMPMIRNSTSTGRPIRADSLLETMPTRIRMAASRMILSIRNTRRGPF